MFFRNSSRGRCVTSIVPLYCCKRRITNEAIGDVFEGEKKKKNNKSRVDSTVGRQAVLLL